jgi:hypothetical protein
MLGQVGAILAGDTGDQGASCQQSLPVCRAVRGRGGPSFMSRQLTDSRATEALGGLRMGHKATQDTPW